MNLVPFIARSGEGICITAYGNLVKKDDYEKSLSDNSINPAYLLEDWLTNALPPEKLDLALSIESSEHMQDKWLYFFKNWNKSNAIPAKIQEKELIEAYRSMEEYNWNNAERDAYLKANIALTDEYDARRKEREEGKEEERRNIAKNLLKFGLNPQQTCQMTGLSA